MGIPEQVSKWMLEQLHLKTDNIHIHNTGFPGHQHVLSLYLQESDGKGGWIEKSIGSLKPDESRWITINVLSFSLSSQPQPLGESVLIVRTEEPLKEFEAAFWRIDNIDFVYDMYTGAYNPSDSLSYTGSQLLWDGLLKPRTSSYSMIADWGFVKRNAHWEYKFYDKLIPNPLP